MSSNFELFAAFLVDMGRTVDGETLDAGGKRNRSSYRGAGTLCRIDDLTRRIIEIR